MKDTDLRKERDNAFFYAYREALKSNDFKYQSEAVNFVRTHGAPRFFVSPQVCSVFMGRLMRGERLKGIHPLSRRKFEELYRRFCALRENPVFGRMPCSRVCELIVDEPAPEWYIGYELASNIVARQIREYNDRRAREMWR